MSASQCEQILSHLQQGHSITPIEALDKFGCFRLGGRIKDLRNQGHDIYTEMITTPSGKRVAQYSLKREPEQKDMFGGSYQQGRY